MPILKRINFAGFSKKKQTAFIEETKAPQMKGKFFILRTNTIHEKEPLKELFSH